MSNITILRAGNQVPLNVFDFPAGEVGVKIDLGYLKRLVVAPSQRIVARIQGSKDLVTLMMVVDALRHIDDTPIHLTLPYIPYARQDRVCVPGEAFSLKVLTNLINSLDFKTVTVLDPHSDVSSALIDRLTVITQVNIVDKWPELCNHLRLKPTLVSPDAGANKKTSALAGYLGHPDFIRADKKRNLESGKIVEILVYADRLDGQTVAIVDDICDGGATFTGLAQALKAKGAERVILYVTHGIFSKGLDPIFAGGIDEVWTTNSFKTGIDPRAKVLDIANLI